MADYPDITLLTDLDPTTPAGTESASKLDDAIRQVKKFLTTYLATSLNADGTLKNGAATLASLTDAVITYAKIQNVSTTDRVLGRQSAGAGVIEEIICTAFGRSLMADVNAAAAQATLGLAAMALRPTVSTGDIDTGAITAAKIANGTITSVQLAAAAILAADIAGGAVTVDKLGWTGGTDSVPRIMGKGTAASEMLIGGVMTATVDTGTSPPTLKFALAGSTSVVPPSGTSATNIGYARLEERYTSGTGAGGTTATTWVDRVSLDEASDPLDMVSTSSGVITFKKQGIYLVDVWCPCSGAVGFHRSRIYNVTAAAVLKVGSTAQCPAGCTTLSHIREIIEVSADNTLYKMQTWATNTVATTGLGAPASTGDQEIYSIFEIFKIG